ncbi:MAG: hypothetical protein AMS14_05160 [Planctomycetes bacterium DG_20]|nr:MAG: hypothetical protein AMS14_05160 [Planctomycetes bacterium DG_20]
MLVAVPFAGLFARALDADEVVLTTGIPLSGRVLRATEDEVLVQTEDGRRVGFPRPKVAQIKLSEPAVLRLAEEIYAEGRYAAAAEGYQRAVSALGTGLLCQRTRLKLVECLIAGGEEARAVEAFLDLLNEDPQSPAALALPLFGMALNDPAGVIAALGQRERSAADDRVLSVLRALRSWAHLSAGDTERAARLADDLARASDPSAQSLGAVCQGWRTYRAGRAAEAAGEIERVRPRLAALARPHAEMLLAHCYGSTGQHREALLAALRLAFAYDDFPHLAAEGLYLAGQNFAAIKQTPQALAMFRQLAGTYPMSRRRADARRRIQELERPVATQPSTPAPQRPATP